MQNLDTLDSRALRAVDCYGQRFMREGSYAYHVLPAGGGAINLDRPFKIDVAARKSDGKMTQRHVALRWDGQRFVPEHDKLAIEAGDLVSWNCPDQKAPAFEIAGDKGFFGSASLVNECGYSHAFGLPGTYHWADGSDSGGLVGYSTNTAYSSHCYWDIETSLQNTSAYGEGRTTEEMTFDYSDNTYVDWDFQNFWAEDLDSLNNGYPILQHEINKECPSAPLNLKADNSLSPEVWLSIYLGIILIH